MTIVIEQLELGRRPFVFKSTMKKKMLEGKTISAHIARTGTFKGYRDGEFELTRSMFDQMIKNFQSEKNPLPVYFGHSDTLPLAEEPEAKGWILSLERKGDDLWAQVEMTQEMETNIKEGKFRFTSIFCRTGNVHRETGEKIGARLFSLAITNSPFIDGLEALSLSYQQNNGKADTYVTKEIKVMIDQNKNAKHILSALALDATEERLSALEAALKGLGLQEDEMPAGEGEEGPEGEGSSGMEEKLEALRKMASEMLGEELDLEGLMGMMEEMLKSKSEEMAAAQNEEKSEALTEGANTRKADGPDAVGVVASNHPAFIALKSELSETQKLVKELQAEKEAREAKDVESIVLSAIEEGKILESSKDKWIKVMETDKELGLSLLNDREAVSTKKVVKANVKDGKKQSNKVIALSEHEQRILAGAGLSA